MKRMRPHTVIVSISAYFVTLKATLPLASHFELKRGTLNKHRLCPSWISISAQHWVPWSTSTYLRLGKQVCKAGLMITHLTFPDVLLTYCESAEDKKWEQLQQGMLSCTSCKNRGFVRAAHIPQNMLKQFIKNENFLLVFFNWIHMPPPTMTHFLCSFHNWYSQ